MVFRLIFGKQKEIPVSLCRTGYVALTDRVYAIGDIHGRDDLLRAEVRSIAVDMRCLDDGRKPTIVFLGDYIDRGDNSDLVLQTLIDLKADDTFKNAVFLRGNHEQALLDFIEDPVLGAAWLRFGGLQTLGSYGVPAPKPLSNAAQLRRAGQALQDAMGVHLGFLRATTHWFRSGNVVFVHAGLDPKRPLDQQTQDAMLWGRSSFIERGGYDGLRVVHGHYADDAPVISMNRVCLDTGAYYSGRLTTMRFDAQETILTAPKAKPQEGLRAARYG